MISPALRFLKLTAWYNSGTARQRREQQRPNLARHRRPRLPLAALRIQISPETSSGRHHQPGRHGGGTAAGAAAGKVYLLSSVRVKGCGGHPARRRRNLLRRRHSRASFHNTAAVPILRCCVRGQQEEHHSRSSRCSGMKHAHQTERDRSVPAEPTKL